MIVPRLWTETIEAHKREVSDAVLDAAIDLVTERGLVDVTMAEIATRSGIGRATLYKYYPSLDAVLAACHDRAVTRHLAELRALAVTETVPGVRLVAVVRGYAERVRGHGSPVVADLHTGSQTAKARDELHSFLSRLINEAAAAGEVRGDVPAAELAGYCISALAPTGHRTRPATTRLVDVVLDGLGVNTGR